MRILIDGVSYEGEAEDIAAIRMAMAEVDWTSNAVSRIRWQAVVLFRSSEQPGLTSVHDLEEISDLHEIIEMGPNYDTIESIVITRVNHIDSPALTIEQSARQ